MEPLSDDSPERTSLFEIKRIDKTLECENLAGSGLFNAVNLWSETLSFINYS